MCILSLGFRLDEGCGCGDRVPLVRGVECVQWWIDDGVAGSRE